MATNRINVKVAECPEGNVYATATGFRITARGKVQDASKFLGRLSKSTARKLRKACRKHGMISLASAPRIAG